MTKYYYQPSTENLYTEEAATNIIPSKPGLKPTELGFYEAFYLDYSSEYNPFTHKVSDSTTWVVYDTMDSYRASGLPGLTATTYDPAGPSAFGPFDTFYVGTKTIVALTGSELSDAQDSAKGIVQKEVLKRLDEVTTLQSSGYDRTELETYKNQLTNLYLDSVYPSVIAHSLGGKDSGWPVAPTITLDSGPTSSGRLAQVYASWNGSTAGSYDWANDQLSSFGVDSVSRIQEGSFRVYFDKAFTDSNYTVTTGVGAENYGGANASPRQLTVIRSEMTPNYVTVHCERTDDAVDEDNEYMSVIVMGTQ